MGKRGCASGLRMSRCGTFSSSATSSSLPSCPQLSSSIPRLASIRKINWGHVPFFSIFTASRFSFLPLRFGVGRRLRPVASTCPYYPIWSRKSRKHRGQFVICHGYSVAAGANIWSAPPSASHVCNFRAPCAPTIPSLAVSSAQEETFSLQFIPPPSATLADTRSRNPPTRSQSARSVHQINVSRAYIHSINC